jgi:protein TonB
MNKNLILKTDVLDIIFEKRNKLYGAYDLRKFYQHRLKLALVTMFITAVVFSGFTLIPDKNKIAAPVFTPPEPIFKNVDITPKDPEKKPELPKTETKPVVKATPLNQKIFTSHIVIVPKGIKTDSITTLLPTDITGPKTIVDATPGPFLVTPVKTEPGDGGGKSAVTIDKNIPMNGDAVEVLPSYPGGMDALRKFLEKNLQTPTEMENGETVSVRVKFVVDYTGKLKNFETVLDGGEAYNKEVIRVLKKMPDWVPGKAKGENVSVYYIIPVKFTGAD